LETLEGRPEGRRRRIGIACSRFNGQITSRLLDGAVAALEGAGVARNDITVLHVPGAFELPLAAKLLFQDGEMDAVVALGAVIRGETDHYDHVCRAAQDGLLMVGLWETKPVLFGVLTCENEEQAIERSGGSHGNKGADAALDALRMASLVEQLDGGAEP